MTVYVDSLCDWNWYLGRSCHLIADTVEELHEFAARLGMKRTWFQRGSFPHYDLTERRRTKALELGAVSLGRADFVARVRVLRLLNEPNLLGDCDDLAQWRLKL